VGLYNGVKFLIYSQINRQLPQKIDFSNLSLSFYPLGIHIRDIKWIPLENKNLVSFKSASIEIPFWSIFSSFKEFDLIIHDPRILINRNLFKGKKSIEPRTGGMPFKIRAIKITNGELLFVDKKLSINLIKFNLDSVQFPDYTSYQLTSPLLKAVFPIEGKRVTVQGNLTTQIKQTPESIKINKFFWSTRDFRVNAHGRFFKDSTMNLNTFLQGNPKRILRPLLKDLNVSGLCYGNARITLDRNRKLAISGRFDAKTFTCNREKFSDLQGRITWNNLEDMVRINTFFQDGDLSASLKIDSRKNLAHIQGANIRGNRVAKVIEIYREVPLGGVVRDADLTLESRILTGTVRVEKQNKETPDFNFKGQIDFRYDTRKKIIDFRSDRLDTEFGNLTITGHTVLPQKITDLDIRARISDTGAIDKYSRYFIDLDLRPWKLREGEGRIDIRFNRNQKKRDFSSSLDLRNFQSSGRKIERMTGEIRGQENSTRGNFRVMDPSLKGKARLDIQDDKLKIDFNDIRGESAKILGLLNLDLDIQGPMQGDFQYTLSKNPPLPLIQGRFNSGNLRVYGIQFDRVSGNLESNLEHIRLKELNHRCYGGQGEAELFIDYKNRRYNIKGETRDIQIKRIHPGFRGIGRISLNGSGAFEIDPIRMSYRIENLGYYQDRRNRVSGQAAILTDFSQYDFKTVGYVHHDLNSSPFNIQLNQTGGRYTGTFKIHLKDINLIMPWQNHDGRLVLNGQIKTDPAGRINWQGLALVNGDVLAIPGFPHTLNRFRGMITFQNSRFTLSSLQGILAEGPVEANGRLSLDQGRVKDLMINFSGQDMKPYLIDRASGTVNADLNLKQEGERLMLQGNIHFTSLLWEREMEEGIAFYSQSQDSKGGGSLLNRIRFNLNLNGRENIRMKNSFGNITGRFDLKLTGNFKFPVLSGKVTGQEGEIFFSDRTFNLVKARLVFNNKFQIDPFVDMQSEAFIKNYRIRFNIRGPASRVKPEFQSSPPLPPQDILALISLGELFKRPTSTEMSSQISTTGMITTKLTENLEKRVKKIFGIDMIKFDPMINGTSVEGESRLSVGKSIAKNFIIVYSTNVSTSRQEILYLLYQVSPSISIIGMRNEDGRYSIDIRFRKRR
jgi:hypothetical protein